MRYEYDYNYKNSRLLLFSLSLLFYFQLTFFWFSDHYTSLTHLSLFFSFSIAFFQHQPLSLYLSLNLCGFENLIFGAVSLNPIGDTRRISLQLPEHPGCSCCDKQTRPDRKPFECDDYDLYF